MKTTIKAGTAQQAYPCLMRVIGKESGAGAIILMSGRIGVGTVLSDPTGYYNPGYISTAWGMGALEHFVGEVTLSTS